MFLPSHPHILAHHHHYYRSCCAMVHFVIVLNITLSSSPFAYTFPTRTFHDAIATLPTPAALLKFIKSMPGSGVVWRCIGEQRKRTEETLSALFERSFLTQTLKDAIALFQSAARLPELIRTFPVSSLARRCITYLCHRVTGERAYGMLSNEAERLLPVVLLWYVVIWVVFTMVGAQRSDGAPL